MSDFVIIGNPWGASHDNPTSKHQVALSLSRKDHRVIWVDGAGMRTPSLGSGGDRAKIATRIGTALRGSKRVAPNIWRIAPIILPLPGLALARRLNEWIYRSAIHKAMQKLGFTEPSLINFLPTIPGLMKTWEHSAAYYCVDRWGAFAGHDRSLLACLNADCCRNAKVVFASADDLVEACRKHNAKTHLLPHGVEHSHFAGALGAQGSGAELPENTKKRIGFFGLIDERLDKDILQGLVGIADTELILAGKIDRAAISAPEGDDVQLPGPVPYAELPGLIATFDVGIIPYKLNDLTRAINPIKLREMLAAGCPVVAADLPEIRKLAEALPAGAVSIAKDGEDFVRLVRAQLGKELTPAAKKAISDSVKDQDWSSKVDQIISLIRQ